MARRQELTAELAKIRDKYDAAKALEERASAPSREERPNSDSLNEADKPEPLDEAGDIAELWHQLMAELDDLPQHKPWLIGVIALGVGFWLGRATR